MNHLQELLDRTLIKNFDYGTNNFEHILTFFSIALQIRAKNILELGVREGGSTFPFLVASKELGGNTTSIDINNPIFNCPNDLRPYWTFIRTEAITFLQTITEPNYDLIYVDDWHSALQVRTELELIDKISTPNTIILLHDTMPNSVPNYSLTYKMGDEWAGGGPYKALTELDMDKWEYATIPVNHGLTILRKKGEVLIK